MAYRTLVIAPKTNLVLVDSEVTAVINALNANILRDYVTASQALDVLSQGWDIVWFMTHGTKDGILLSDGPLSSSALTTFIRTSQAKLVVLNTCDSITVALKIHNELLTNLVCTLTEIPDQDAFFMSKQLAFHLARGKTFSEAYLDAKPGQNQDYIFLIGKEQSYKSSAALTAVPLMPPTPSASLRDQENYAEQIRELQEAMKGNALFGPGLIATVRSVLDDMEDLKRAVLILQIGGGVIVVVVFVVLATVLSLYLR